MDIRTQWDGTGGRYLLAGGQLATDRDLDSAIILSLFLDRRALPDDVLPAGVESRRGWWGDTFAAVEGDRIGSRLWLLRREKQTQETLNRAVEYSREALQWLVDDRVAAVVSVVAEWARLGTLALGVEIIRPDGTSFDQQYDYVWKQL